MAITTWQSQCIDTKGVGFIPKGISTKKFFNHLAPLLTILKGTNSKAMVDLAIIVYLDNIQVIASSLRVNTKESSELKIHYKQHHNLWYLSNISLV